MPPDISDVISFEVKKDIAERYFGFRKLIEEDKLDLEEKIRQHSFILEKRISFELLRLYIILKQEELIQTFLGLAGLEDRLFYDRLLTEAAAVRRRVFEGVRFRGLTRGLRYRNFGLDCYARLTAHVEHYRESIHSLQEFREIITEEIQQFYRKNDICVIMSFLRSLGDPSVSGGLEGGMEVGMAEALEKKMRIESPFPIEHFLPVLPALKPPRQARPDLLPLIKQAFTVQDREVLDLFTPRLPLLSKRHRKDRK